MAVNFELLESQLTETEMALLMAINVAMDAAMRAGAPPALLVADLDQHEKNFGALGQAKAEHMTAALKALVKNVAGENWRK